MLKGWLGGGYLTYSVCQIEVLTSSEFLHGWHRSVAINCLLSTDNHLSSADTNLFQTCTGDIDL